MSLPHSLRDLALWNQPSDPPPASSLTAPKGMVRRGDHATSCDAAARVKLTVKALRAQVLEAYRRHGAMTQKEVEQLPEFAECGASTCRKRVSELSKAEYFDPPLLVKTGVVRDGCAEYDLAERGTR